MLLRQYFMSLKVLDRWAHLGPHMAQHWENVSQCQPTLPPSTTTNKPSDPGAEAKEKTTPNSKSSWEHFHPATMRARKASVGPLSEHETDVEGASTPPLSAGLDGIHEEAEEERELAVMRKVFRRWCKRAGVHASAEGGELGEGEVDCDWTRAISPKVEGRIVMLGETQVK